jgi:hypothetical protein
VPFQLPALSTAADAAGALAALTAGVAAGDLTPGDAAELSRLVEAYVKALEAQHATGPGVVTISNRDEGL